MSEIKKGDYVRIAPYELSQPENHVLFSGERAMKHRAICLVIATLDGLVLVEYPYPAGLRTNMVDWYNDDQLDIVDTCPNCNAAGYDNEHCHSCGWNEGDEGVSRYDFMDEWAGID